MKFSIMKWNRRAIPIGWPRDQHNMMITMARAYHLAPLCKKKKLIQWYALPRFDYKGNVSQWPRNSHCSKKPSFGGAEML
jgi:hypothetical protein